LEKKGTTWWWDGPVEDFVPENLKTEGEWRKGTDTMDVWFDSGTSWSMFRDEQAHDGRAFHADVCLEGSDQHRGWFQSSLLTTIGALSPEEQVNSISSPYGTLITHGMVLDEKGKKMSKKKEPAYGADVLRLWAAMVEYNSDMNTGPTVLAGCSEMLRKIRNSARFILGNLRVGDEELWQRVPRNDLGLVSSSDICLPSIFIELWCYRQRDM
jgi:isoleucyl-tRNA synthetase